MAYTQDQKKRMIEKLRNMKSGEVFKLNKQDITPIECKLVRGFNGIMIVATELKDEPIISVAGAPNAYTTLEAVVDVIEDYINHWDLMVKQFFISKARLEGRDI